MLQSYIICLAHNKYIQNAEQEKASELLLLFTQYQYMLNISEDLCKLGFQPTEHCVLIIQTTSKEAKQENPLGMWVCGIKSSMVYCSVLAYVYMKYT